MRAAYIVGHNPAETDPHSQRSRRGAQALEFLVVNEIFFTRTAQLAHVVLPAASFRREGRNVHQRRPARATRAQGRGAAGRLQDRRGDHLRAVRADGLRDAGPHAAEIMDEIAGLVPIHGRHQLRRGSSSSPWSGPASTSRTAALQRLYERAFPRGRATFQAIDYSEPMEQTDADYPLILTTGRRLEHYNCGSMSRRIPGLLALAPEERLEIHPQDAAGLGIHEGDVVEVASRRGRLTVRADLTERCPPGVVFLSFHFEEVPTNQLLGNYLDALACTPDYKVTAVRVAPAKMSSVS